MHNKPHTEETKRKMSKNSARFWLGKKKPLSEETKKKIGEANKISLKGIKYPNRKKPPLFTEEHRRKMSEARKGNKNHSWKGGISKQKGYRSFLSARRQVRKLENGGTHTLGEWEHLKALYSWTCPSCWKKEPEIKLTEDHIVALKMGGSDNIENIQPLCGKCNSKKQTKTMKFMNQQLSQASSQNPQLPMGNPASLAAGGSVAGMNNLQSMMTK